MDFVFADSHSIDALSFRRLLILANSVAFVNRPSIELEDNYYTMGVHSNVTEVVPMFQGTPISITVETPPDSVFNSNFYKKYFESDLKNADFVRIILEGVEKGFIRDVRFKDEREKKMNFRTSKIGSLLIKMNYCTLTIFPCKDLKKYLK